MDGSSDLLTTLFKSRLWNVQFLDLRIKVVDVDVADRIITAVWSEFVSNEGETTIVDFADGGLGVVIEVEDLWLGLILAWAVESGARCFHPNPLHVVGLVVFGRRGFGSKFPENNSDEFVLLFSVEAPKEVLNSGIVISWLGVDGKW